MARRLRRRARARSCAGCNIARPRMAAREIPVWVDGALEHAVHPNPAKRYDSLSEFLYDLRTPNANYSRPRPRR